MYKIAPWPKTTKKWDVFLEAKQSDTPTDGLNNGQTDGQALLYRFEDASEKKDRKEKKLFSELSLIKLSTIKSFKRSFGGRSVHCTHSGLQRVLDMESR